MTEKLYDQDAYINSFEAKVLECKLIDGIYNVILDKTAFFPEGGGQACDLGLIGNAVVKDVKLEDDIIVHYLLSEPDCNNGYVHCEIDWNRRFRHMQNHTGEHIVSGIVNSCFGYNNVGFHLGNEYVTADYDGELSYDQILNIEQSANDAVVKNIKINIKTLNYDSSKKIKYRSKLDIKQNIRIVFIPGYDACACCAPHVAYTGEIGLIKIIDYMRHRGGTRLFILCGSDALKDYTERFKYTVEISRMLSSKQNEICSAVKNNIEELALFKQKLRDSNMKYINILSNNISYEQDNICIFESDLDIDTSRSLVNLCKCKCKGIFVCCFNNKNNIWQYVMGSESIDLKKSSVIINSSLSGSGGGSSEMLQGIFKKPKQTISEFFLNFKI